MSVPDDFVYETFVLLRLLLDCKAFYKIVYVPGSGMNAHALPRKPASKAGRPRFEIRDKVTGQVLWQLCAGTKIGDIVGDERAPDISLQVPNASDLPKAKDVVLIWDAKYKKNAKAGSRRISSHDFSEFARWIQLFDLQARTLPPLKLSTLVGMVGHCLVTNGECSSEKDAELKRTHVREVSGMYPGNTHSVRF